MKTNYLRMIWLLPLLLAACEPEPVQTRFLTPEERDGVTRAEMTLTLSPEPVPGGTKASLLHDVEEKGSGALVLVYRSDTRRLDSYRFFTEAEIAGQKTAPLKLRVPLMRCDFFILGNLNAVHRQEDGRITNLMEALGGDFPMDEADLEALVYRLDGGALNGEWRRQKFSEVARFGIPFMHVRKDVDVSGQISRGQGIPESDRCRRLFSKVTVRIDHAAFDGGGADPSLFVNSKLYLRQANARLQPFSEAPQKAFAEEDVLEESDYDPDMANASVATFSFYVPENMQGDLLPDNRDSRRKTLDELVRLGRTELQTRCLTYVEFDGRLDPAAGGYGGDVKYRFYLGADNCSNFDLERGREYEIHLTFRIGSLFDPDWKVELSDWNDRRLFCLTADPGFSDRLPEGRNLAVRANRPGGLYVYMNPQNELGGRNALLGREALTVPDYTPTSLTDCAWSGAFLRTGTEDATWLSERGIVPAWDKASARLSFAVADQAKFASHIGESRTLTLSLLPNGSRTTFRLELLPDIRVTVADGKSLTDEFYLGQKRTLSVSGFAGGQLCYAADQDPCGRSASGPGHQANVQWKANSSESAPFPTVLLDEAGEPLLRAGEYSDQRLSGSSLDVYAFYPNRFQPSHGWTSRDGKILFFSEDYLNDTVEIPVRISEPVFKAEMDEVILPIDGTEVETACGWYTFDGTQRIPATAYDPDLLARRMSVIFTSWTGTHDIWMDSIALDPCTGKMSLRRTAVDGDKLEEHAFSHVNGGWSTYLGRINMHSAAYPELVSNPTHASLRVSTLHIERLKPGMHCTMDSGVNVFSSDYFNAGGPEQLEKDISFSVSVEFSFLGGDLSRVVWKREGKAVTYTSSDSPEPIEPVIDFTVDTPDDGSGGIFSWVYDESRQVSVSPSGKPVPGGLIIPYDTQTMTGTFTNRWDGRSFAVSTSFELTYPVIQSNFLVVARPNSVNASVWLMPYKITKYLKRMGHLVDRQTRSWMMQLFDRSDWMDYVRTKDRYQKRSNLNDYFKPGEYTGMPLTDYNVNYLLYHLQDESNHAYWTKYDIDRVSTIYPSSICKIAFLDFEGYSTPYFHQLSRDNYLHVTGIWWTKGEDF